MEKFKWIFFVVITLYSLVFSKKLDCLLEDTFQEHLSKQANAYLEMVTDNLRNKEEHMFFSEKYKLFCSREQRIRKIIEPSIEKIDYNLLVDRLIQIALIEKKVFKMSNDNISKSIQNFSTNDLANIQVQKQLKEELLKHKNISRIIYKNLEYGFEEYISKGSTDGFEEMRKKYKEIKYRKSIFSVDFDTFHSKLKQYIKILTPSLDEVRDKAIIDRLIQIALIEQRFELSESAPQAIKDLLQNANIEDSKIQEQLKKELLKHRNFLETTYQNRVHSVDYYWGRFKAEETIYSFEELRTNEVQEEYSAFRERLELFLSNEDGSFSDPKSPEFRKDDLLKLVTFLLKIEPELHIRDDIPEELKKLFKEKVNNEDFNDLCEAVLENNIMWAYELLQMIVKESEWLIRLSSENFKPFLGSYDLHSQLNAFSVKIKAEQIFRPETAAYMTSSMLRRSSVGFLAEFLTDRRYNTYTLSRLIQLFDVYTSDEMMSIEGFVEYLVDHNWGKMALEKFPHIYHEHALPTAFVYFLSRKDLASEQQDLKKLVLKIDKYWPKKVKPVDDFSFYEPSALIAYMTCYYNPSSESCKERLEELSQVILNDSWYSRAKLESFFEDEFQETSYAHYLMRIASRFYPFFMAAGKKLDNPVFTEETCQKIKTKFFEFEKYLRQPTLDSEDNVKHLLEDDILVSHILPQEMLHVIFEAINLKAPNKD